MKKNKMLLVLVSGALSFSTIPSVYASKSSEIITSAEINNETINETTAATKKTTPVTNDSHTVATDSMVENSESASSVNVPTDETIVSSDGTNSTTANSSETSNDSDQNEETTSEEQVVKEKTPEEKAVAETLANLPKMELRPDLGPGYYEVEKKLIRVQSAA